MKREKLEELKDYISELKTIKKEKLNEEYIYQDNIPVGRKGFLNIEKYKCYLNNGQEMTREKIRKGGTDKSACIIMPVTSDNKTILVVQPRLSTIEGVSVELPAGYVEEGEYKETAALRELAEETGYISNNLIYLDKFYQDQACGVSAYNYAFLAKNCVKVQEQNLDKDEFIKYFECDVADAYELIDLGYITDIQSKYTMEKAKQYIKIIK